MPNLVALYDTYTKKPYVSSNRDLSVDSLSVKPVPRKNMEPLGDGLLAGDIILMWRVSFGTFTTKSPMPKYLEYTYGVDGKERLVNLLAKGYVIKESPFESLDHLNTSQKKVILKDLGISGLSQLSRSALDQLLRQQTTEAVLGKYFTVRGYALTPKGQAALDTYQAVVDRHPQKKF